MRFEVFNLELNEGLVESHFTGLDADPFDDVCDHLVIEDRITGEVVGTYRLQSGQLAQDNIGYYSEREFDFSPYAPFRSQIIELGRACVHVQHRTFKVLHLLWRSIALYAGERRARFLLGCSSLTSQDPVDGRRLYSELTPRYLVRPELRTTPREAFSIAGDASPGLVKLKEGAPSSANGASAKLLRAYLTIGAKICGPPAIDREFGTIDFLTLLDLEKLPAIVRAHFFR